MYGYVIPDKPTLRLCDYALFRAFYCGVCKATGKGKYGQLARAATNYDIAFFAVVLFAYTGTQPAYDEKGCILNPIKKKLAVKPCPLLSKVVAFNQLLAYHNLTDDIIDGEGLKKYAARSFFKRGYRRAKRLLPAVDAAITSSYDALRALEKANAPSPDRAAHCFAAMLAEVAAILVAGAPEEKAPPQAFSDFFYQLGRYIYLVDAVDDADADFKSGAYNPLVALYGHPGDRLAFFAAHRPALDILVVGSIARMRDALALLPFTEGRTLVENVAGVGLRKRYEQIISAPKKPKAAKI
ncbi:MAG: DUF5685 family protein [Clostridiales bacterium]|jgi:hypothetical protein|nr:DUF5685 family protein [Clostridiales bacterium]